jgi:3-phytase
MRGNRVSRSAVVAALAVSLLVGGLAAGTRAADAPAAAGVPTRLEFLGEQRLADGLGFEGTTVGGLSGIDYDPKGDLWFLISDDRSATGPARFYTASIDLDADGIGPVELTGVTPLLRPDGTTFPPAGAGQGAPPDPEAVRLDPRTRTLLWTSEGERDVPATGPPVLLDPWVREATTAGAFVGQLPTAPQFHMNLQEVGPRRNGTLEGLALSDDGHRVVTAMEGPLFQDGPDPTPTQGAYVRITAHRRRGGLPAVQHAYPVEPIFAPPPTGQTGGNNGVTEILAAGADRWLVLERGFVPGLGNRARIFVADTGRASDVLGRDSLAGGGFRPAAKRLLLDLADVPGLELVDNLEGMTWGPRLRDGRRTLVLVSDNNFNPAQVTQFLAFAVAG